MLTTEQLEKRKTGIGGSDAATLLYLNPYKTPYELWQEKTGQVIPEDISEKFAVKRGNDMEALVCKWFSEETDLVAHRVNKTLTNPDFPFMVGHIDRRIVGKKEGLEAKTANWRMAMHFGEAGTDDVPPYYLIQCLHYMIVTGWRVWHLAADIGGDFKIYRIEYDEELGNFLSEKIRTWWTDHILKGIEPDPKTGVEIDLAYPTATQLAIDASEEIALIHGELKTVHAEIKKLKAHDDGLRNQIKASMGDAVALMHDGKKIATWSNSDRSQFNRKSFDQAHPGLYEEYSSPKSIRTFRPNLKITEEPKS